MIAGLLLVIYLCFHSVTSAQAAPVFDPRLCAPHMFYLWLHHTIKYMYIEFGLASWAEVGPLWGVRYSHQSIIVRGGEKNLLFLVLEVM